MNQFRATLPRLAELHDRFGSQHRDNFFESFPNRLGNRKSATYRFYRRIENWLSYVPLTEWPGFQARVGAVVTTRDKKEHRDWEKLHDLFNEALGMKLLATKFRCKKLVFLRTTGASKTPDLCGTTARKVHYMEVKTINHSLDERMSWYGRKELIHTTVLPQALIKKIKGSYTRAIYQLKAPLDAGSAKKIVLLVLNPDHNVDPIEVNLEKLFLDLLDSIEISEFPIYACIRNS